MMQAPPPGDCVVVVVGGDDVVVVKGGSSTVILGFGFLPLQLEHMIMFMHLLPLTISYL